MKKLLTPRDDMFVIRNFLSDEECDKLIGTAEKIGFGVATVNTSEGAIVNSRMRNNDRVIVDDTELSTGMWSKVKDHIPEKRGCKPCAVNERFRFYRYEPSQFFDWHFDASYKRNESEFSLLTFMVYLNEGCEGGTTDFHMKNGRVLDDDPSIIKVKPEKGMALVFTHNVLHRGTEIISGVKYVVRSDIMYRNS